ncbi:hypothetical protein IMG5_069880 [Ichthyophthirius multifiliis]|uniref:Uncharacterized protein n=1 Tax=Ichthyophthirius multifiliis TaxID=5932 RepID=G0QPN7_ICHMU|nr:hypothetical protein IMG5_069880 [Ichthyophthirius multifiliis]EGR32815.1 hypothetical protein IMG5_069880 [Ichthyophthirius multifiliis]|eukprot:XP_004036801.1 hypothetical protein IMG5_069880 [Ichthyophthirius multifiliis]
MTTLLKNKSSFLPPINGTNKSSQYEKRLNYLGEQKEQKSPDFFKDTRVNSCSYIKVKVNVPQAVPYYTLANQSYADKITKSTYINSLNSDVYKIRQFQHAGMKNKLLEPYSMNSYRNRLPIKDVDLQFQNATQIELGNRYQNVSRRFISQSKNTYGNFGKFDPVSNPGINSRCTKWHHYLQSK